MPQMKAR